MSNSTFNFNHKNGFTLIEIIIALGISASVIIGTCMINPVFFFGWGNLFILALLVAITQSSYGA